MKLHDTEMGVDIHVLFINVDIASKIWCKIAIMITKHEHRSFVVHCSVEIITDVNRAQKGLGFVTN